MKLPWWLGVQFEQFPQPHLWLGPVLILWQRPQTARRWYLPHGLEIFTNACGEPGIARCAVCDAEALWHVCTFCRGSGGDNLDLPGEEVCGICCGVGGFWQCAAHPNCDLWGLEVDDGLAR